ncbi:MAG: hypothetical protein OZ921_20990 [Sorangiineae bacterium]|nr:hypothetical protein [Sorangiineae bacterium]
MHRSAWLLGLSLTALATRAASAQPHPADAPDAPAASDATPADAVEPASDAPAPPSPATTEPRPAPEPPTEVAPAQKPALSSEEPVDTLGGHLSASPSAALALPFGELAEGTSQTALLGMGSTFGLELGYGVSRAVVIGLWGTYSHFGGGDDCASCSADAISAGPFIRYHLVQGLRFDPWLEAGLGFRRLAIEAPEPAGVSAPAGSSTWAGVEWLRLVVGGDWYALSQVGFGPFLGLDVASFSSRPAGSGAATAAWQFTSGVRLTLDLPGK